MGDLIQLIGVSTVCAAGLIGVVGLVVRVVLVPVARSKHLAAAAQAQSQSSDTARLDGRMDALEEEVRRLGESLERVAATAEFDAQLRAGAAPPPQLPGA
jgi:hypothetical protein